ncbi:hypothetical protein Hanom_Chr09g00865691 [Helianthus anomalus]
MEQYRVSKKRVILSYYIENLPSFHYSCIHILTYVVLYLRNTQLDSPSFCGAIFPVMIPATRRLCPFITKYAYRAI